MTPHEEVRVTTQEEADGYLSRAEAFTPLGRSLIFRISEEVLKSHRNQFRATFPEAVLRPIPPPRPYTLDRPVAYQRRGLSLGGVSNFRELPPCTELPRREPPGGGYAQTYVGSGVPASAHPLAKDWFSRCMNCAGTDTRVISASSATHYGRIDTSQWDECEYECMECGWFTYHQVNREF